MCSESLLPIFLPPILSYASLFPPPHVRYTRNGYTKHEAAKLTACNSLADVLIM